MLHTTRADVKGSSCSSRSMLEPRHSSGRRDRKSRPRPNARRASRLPLSRSPSPSTTDVALRAHTKSGRIVASLPLGGAQRRSGGAAARRGIRRCGLPRRPDFARRAASRKQRVARTRGPNGGRNVSRASGIARCTVRGLLRALRFLPPRSPHEGALQSHGSFTTWRSARFASGYSAIPFSHAGHEWTSSSVADSTSGGRRSNRIRFDSRSRRRPPDVTLPRSDSTVWN